MREEFIQAVGIPPARQLGEDVREVRQRWHPVLGAGSRQAVQGGGAPRRVVRAREQVVLPAERDVTELLLAEGMPRARLCRVSDTGQRHHTVS